MAPRPRVGRQLQSPPYCWALLEAVCYDGKLHKGKARASARQQTAEVFVDAWTWAAVGISYAL